MLLLVRASRQDQYRMLPDQVRVDSLIPLVVRWPRPERNAYPNPLNPDKRSPAPRLLLPFARLLLDPEQNRLPHIRRYRLACTRHLSTSRRASAGPTLFSPAGKELLLLPRTFLTLRPKQPVGHPMTS